MGTNDALRSLRILIVDHDKDSREMLRFILQQAGGDVIATDSITKAFENYKSATPDVIVSDIAMPEYGSYALLSLTRAHDKKFGRTTPVIAFTAYTSPDDKERALAAGFQ